MVMWSGWSVLPVCPSGDAMQEAASINEKLSNGPIDIFDLFCGSALHSMDWPPPSPFLPSIALLTR